MGRDRGRVLRAALVGVVGLGLIATGCTAAGAGAAGSAPSATVTTATPLEPSPSSAPSPSDSTGQVSTGVLFNDPWGSRAEQRTLLAAQVKAIRKTRKGATITLLAYSISDPAVVNSLIAASRRGVRVRILLSDHGDYRRGNRLAATLGQDTSKNSYLVKCYLACASDVTYPNPLTGEVTRPYMHAKAMAISATGRDEWVVMVPSGNLTIDSTESQANDLLVVRNDKAMYDFVVDRFDVMRRDKGNTAGQVESGSVGMRLFPEVPTIPKSGKLPAPDPADDPYAALLDDITCVVGGTPTRLDIAMYLWSTPRRYLARRTAALSAAGCDVRVFGTPVAAGRWGLVWDPSIRRALQARGDVEIRQIDVETDRILHTKIILIDGWDAAGNRITRTYSGSPNFIAQALFWSDELAWHSTEPAILTAERDWMDRVLVAHSRKVR
ncbi:MAG: hypothetical protein KDB60_15285 [Propionibacteriaceae bacterium]|nr:hypothetical protein [Propionibacteriaceae bacterium]